MVKSKQGYKLYSREEIKSLVTDWYNTHGKIIIRDLRHKNGLPSVAQVTNEFGTFQDCLIECGIEIDNKNLFNRICLSDEEMLENFRIFVKKHLEKNLLLPSYNNVDNSDMLQGSCVYLRRFKSIENIYSLIGYDMNSYNKNAIENDMIKKYKYQCELHNHVLTSREIDEISKDNANAIYSSSSYITHFGSIHKTQEICGLHKTSPGKNATRDELILQLVWLSKELGRTPVQTDLILYKNVSSTSEYQREFGSFKNALKESGLSSSRILRTKNGVMCRSTYELKLAQVLESYGIEFKNEVMYSTIIPDFKRRYRFDFKIFFHNSVYFIELFGIEGNEKYEKRKEEKIDLCNKYSIPLIQIYQNDIYAKTNEEIYQMIIEKTNLTKVA